MNLQHSQWNQLRGFGVLLRKVDKSDAHFINKYHGHSLQLNWKCIITTVYGLPHTICTRIAKLKIL